MSEFELLTLFNEYFDATFARLNDFMAGTFAMLISAFFAAAKMTPRLSRLVVFLYSIFATATIVPVLMAANRFARAGELLEAASVAPGSIIGELFPLFPIAIVIVPTMAILLLGAFAGTLAFYFHARKSGNQTPERTLSAKFSYSYRQTITKGDRDEIHQINLRRREVFVGGVSLTNNSFLLRRIARHVREYEWFAVAVEILVIIVGLMLALQLDRWREDRAERSQERTYINLLISDVQADIPAIEYAIQLQSLRLELVDLLMAVAFDPERSMVEPTVFLGAVKQAAYTYTPSLTSHTFENLRSTGDLGLILGQSVKDELFGYYGFDEEQRQYRPLQFSTEARHFELAAGILSTQHELYIQDFWLFFRPDNVDKARISQPPDPENVMAAALRLQGKPELVAWLPYVRDMQLEQIAVHQMRLERARRSLETLQKYAQGLTGE